MDPDLDKIFDEVTRRFLSNDFYLFDDILSSGVWRKAGGPGEPVPGGAGREVQEFASVSPEGQEGKRW